jgi:hypothetical protein
MHQLTINLMAKRGVEVLMLRRPTIRDASIASDDTTLGQCLGCEGFGAIYTLCTTCEDSSLIYDPIESSDESDDSVIPALEVLGTCPSCDGTGSIGQTCTTCKTDAVYLNFNAGL